MHEIRHALRTLIRRPAFTAVAAATLAIGIGPNAILFSLVEGVLFRPLPYQEPERMVALWETVPRKFRVTPANYLDWRRQGDGFQSMAAFGSAGFNLTGEGEPVQVLGVRAEPGFFSTLGVRPLLGRLFAVEDGEGDQPQVALLSEGLWKDRFGADPGIVGQSIQLDGAPCTVVGVLPRGPYPSWPTSNGTLSFLEEQQRIFVPMRLTGDFAANRRSHVLGVIARLAPGTTLSQAQVQMDGLASRLAAQYPEWNEGEGALVTSLAAEATGDVRPALVVLLCAVGLVLLIACANVCSLVLARSGVRRREVAIRTAIGAGRGRLARQFLLEGLTLSLIGGLVGAWIAFVGLDAVTSLIPQKIPRLAQVSIDSRVLLFTLLVACLSGIVVGLVPAFKATTPDLLALRGGFAATGPGGKRGRQAVVVAQVGMAFVLLFGATLLIQTFLQLRRVDSGLQAENVLAVDLNLPSSRYSGVGKIADFSGRMVDAVSGVPGVESAAFGYDSPLAANWTDSYVVEGEDDPSKREPNSAQLRQVSPGYFETAGIPLVRGRRFDDRDDLSHPGVVVINQALADRDFAGRDPLGRRLTIGTPSNMWGEAVPKSFEIVGVVGNVRFRGPAVDVEPAFYLPSKQFPLRQFTLLARCDKDPLQLVSAIRARTAELDPELPLSSITTLESLLAERVAQPRFNMLLMALFGVVALLLAGVGLFGLLSQTVARRRHEIGLRMALGADRSRVLRMVVGEGLALAIGGLVLGLAVSLVLAQGFSSLLFGVSAVDPVSCVVAAVVLLAIAVLACVTPAARASRIDPLRALRWE